MIEVILEILEKLDSRKVSDQNNSSNTKEKVVILGDSMIKHINRWKLSKKLEECKIYVKKFFGAKSAASPGPVLNVLCTFNLHHLSREYLIWVGKV